MPIVWSKLHFHYLSHYLALEWANYFNISQKRVTHSTTPRKYKNNEDPLREFIVVFWKYWLHYNNNNKIPNSMPFFSIQLNSWEIWSIDYIASSKLSALSWIKLEKPLECLERFWPHNCVCTETQHEYQYYVQTTTRWTKKKKTIVRWKRQYNYVYNVYNLPQSGGESYAFIRWSCFVDSFLI